MDNAVKKGLLVYDPVTKGRILLLFVVLAGLLFVGWGMWLDQNTKIYLVSISHFVLFAYIFTYSQGKPYKCRRALDVCL